MTPLRDPGLFDAVHVLRLAVEGVLEGEKVSKAEAEGLSKICDAGEVLMLEFFNNQRRIADALERIAAKKSGWLK